MLHSLLVWMDYYTKVRLFLLLAKSDFVCWMRLWALPLPISALAVRSTRGSGHSAARGHLGSREMGVGCAEDGQDSFPHLVLGALSSDGSGWGSW